MTELYRLRDLPEYDRGVQLDAAFGVVMVTLGTLATIASVTRLLSAPSVVVGAWLVLQIAVVGYGLVIMKRADRALRAGPQEVSA